MMAQVVMGSVNQILRSSMVIDCIASMECVHTMNRADETCDRLLSELAKMWNSSCGRLHHGNSTALSFNAVMQVKTRFRDLYSRAEKSVQAGRVGGEGYGEGNPGMVGEDWG